MEKLQVVMTVVLSGLTLFLVYRQYMIQRYRVKMDLFDRRFNVYSHVRKFILTGSKDGGTKLEIIQNFLSNVPEYEFIFDNKSEIVKYINDIVDRGLKYRHLHEQSGDLNSFPVGSHERKQLMDEIHPHVEYFTQEFEMVKYRFTKYLHLGEADE